jgi:hypothetical protein
MPVRGFAPIGMLEFWNNGKMCMVYWEDGLMSKLIIVK